MQWMPETAIPVCSGSRPLLEARFNASGSQHFLMVVVVPKVQGSCDLSPHNILGLKSTFVSHIESTKYEIKAVRLDFPPFECVTRSKPRPL
jgi:hypothetical protein